MARSTTGGWHRPGAGNFAGGWQPDPDAQLDIRCLGDYFLIDESEVIEVQHEILVTFERLHAK